MKKVFLVAMISLLILFGSSMLIIANDLPKNKLGYGFESGLIAGKDYVSGQLIVGIKRGVTIQSISQAVKASGGRTVSNIENAILLEFPSDQAAKDAVKNLIESPDVTFVERNGFMSIPPKPELPDLKNRKKINLPKGDLNSSLISPESISAESISALSVSDDPGTGYQWHHTVIRKTSNLGNLSATPPTVAVIDTGVDYTHPDLSGKVIKGKNCYADNNDPFDDNGHGTHVAGIIAAKSDNDKYGEGVCPNCKILAVKVLGSDGTGTFFDVACGMQNARTKTTTPATEVINMSLAGSKSELITDEVDAIKDAGMVLVAAAGNDNTTSTASAFPGADPDTALRVMATEENDCRAYFSNFSPGGNPTRYNIAAPGWQIESTLPEAGYGFMSGTSQASPIVAGAAALVWGEFPGLTRDEVVSRIIDNGKKISCGFAASTKRVDVRKAIRGTPETAIIGRMLDPFTGKTPTSPTTPTTAQLFSGTTKLASDQTNTGGCYEIKETQTKPITGTNRVLKGYRTGYVNATVRNKISISADKVAGPFTDALPKARATGNITLTLDWKRMQPNRHTTGCVDTCNGWELDLMVKLPENLYPSGFYVSPYCENDTCTTGDLLAEPYVKSPRDSITKTDLVPVETIVIDSSAADGIYKVIVDKWFYEDSSWNPSWVGSLASVQKYNGANSNGTYTPEYSTCGTKKYWYVGNLTKTGTSYKWTSVNTCSNSIP